LRDRLKSPRFPQFLRTLEIFTDETQVQLNVVETERPIARAFFDWCGSVAALDYETAAGTFRVSPRSFFQVNRFLLDKLVETALGENQGDIALDLYAGVGLFAVAMARRFRTVTAVEVGASAARDLQFNAARNEVKLLAEHTRVEEFLIKLNETPDFVVADPPRAGLGKQVVGELLRLKPRSIAIVSCDPATLARDIAALRAYRIERLTVVDLFPQTYHLETIAHLALM
jgi:23S rRNA (uracil1939-C5)-methyltransferase